EQTKPIHLIFFTNPRHLFGRCRGFVLLFTHNCRVSVVLEFFVDQRWKTRLEGFTSRRCACPRSSVTQSLWGSCVSNSGGCYENKSQDTSQISGSRRSRRRRLDVRGRCSARG